MGVRPGSTVVEGSRQLGVSRPPLDVADLPTPEEVFGVRRLGFKETLRYAVGPSLIALGVSIGSGEWLLGPAAIGAGGFRGLAVFAFGSIVFQAFYNMEIARYVTATGEVPIIGFGRVPPGYLLWVPLALFCLYLTFALGGWAAAAGQGLYTIITGEAAAGSSEPVRLIAIGLIVVVVVLTMLAKKVSRALELANWIMVVIILAFLILATLFIVSPSMFVSGVAGFLTPALPPPGTTAASIGGLVGFAAMSSGMNWYLMGHYRDKGYGMGSRVGYIAGLRGERQEVRSTGVTFPDDERNAAVWKRWMHFLRIDIWGVFFIGALLGMLLPVLLVTELAARTGTAPSPENIATFAGVALGQLFGSTMFYLALFVGVLILFSTQLGIFEALVRNTADAVTALSSRLRDRIEGDPRRFYFSYMIVLGIVISIIIHLALPVRLVQLSANMANLGALLFPFALIYLNRRLPEAARPPAYTTPLLILFAVFFGFFFVNFVAETFFGQALVQF
ncbi:MAG: Nramp family divalent metal transporter [Egibacteraceae bacterium]